MIYLEQLLWDYLREQRKAMITMGRTGMCVAMVVVVIALSAVEATAEGAEVAELMGAELQKWVYVPDEQTSGECHTLTPFHTWTLSPPLEQQRRHGNM